MRGHEPIVLDKFMGLWDRYNLTDLAGKDESCPIDHALDFDNMRFAGDRIRSRPGLDRFDIFFLGGVSVLRMHTFRTTVFERDLIMDASRRIWDRSTVTILATGPVGANDFALINLYNRCYFMFFAASAGEGITGDTVYVYDGTTCRTAGGTAPVGTITAASGGLGKVEIGIHAYAVAFETASGFITKAGGFVSFNSGAPNLINLSTIPLGPAGTVARHVLMTKIAYTGWAADNWNDIEFFFVPGGRIPDNVTTTFAVSAYDADLVASADYLLDELVTIPAGSCFTELNGRLCISGFPGVDNPLVRVSKPGLPESFSSIDGFVLCRPGDGGIVKAITTHRDTLMMHKEFRTSMTRDNQNAPASWEVIPIDNTIGTSSCHGISKVLDVQGPSTDYYLIASKTGLERFSGSFDTRPLTWKVQGIWNRITATEFYQIQVVQDPILKRIYISLPLDGSTALFHILVGDYELGLDPDSIRWSIWFFSDIPVTIQVRMRSDKSAFRWYSTDGIYEVLEANGDFDRNDLNEHVAILSKYTTPYLGENQNNIQNHFAGMRVRGEVDDGAGAGLTPTYAGLDGILTGALPMLVPNAVDPGKSLVSAPFSIVAEKICITFAMSAVGAYFNFRKIIVFLKNLGNDTPNA